MDPGIYLNEISWAIAIAIALIWVAARALGMEKHGRFVAPGIAFVGFILMLIGFRWGIYPLFLGLLVTFANYVVRDFHPTASKQKKDQDKQ